MTITSLRGSTLPNKSFGAGRAKTRDVVRIAPDTATTFANGAAISTGGGGGGGPTISNVSVTDSGYILSNTTPYIDSTGGYIKITGTGFATGCTVYVSGTPATSTTFVSATEVRAQVGAASSNAQSVYVVNTDNSVGILLNAITYSGTPSWSTGATLSSQISDIEFSISLSATSDSSITYSLASGSSTPSGTTLYSNGVFAGTVTGISSDTNYSFTVVATDVENQLSTRAFTVSVSAGDQYFYITPLLLSGDANVWITDASTNKFLPSTIAGDTKPTAFSPYNPYWSGYFDGNGDYLSIAHNTALNLSTGNFTIEAWVYWNGVNASSALLSKDGVSGSSYPSYSMGISSGKLTIYLGSGNGVSALQTIASTIVFPANQWVHVALVKSGTVITMFHNGANVTVATQSVTITDGGKALLIGYETGQPTSSYWSGYISNARIVKGLAVYTGNFTPQTSSLSSTQSSSTNVAAISSETSLLTLQNNRFVDNSTNAFAITRNGDAAIRSFGVLADTDTTTGSGYFDGSGDYLQYASNSAFAFGTGTYTVEAWVYILSVPGSAAAVFDAGSATGSFGLSILNTTRNLFVNTYGTGQLSTLVTSTGIPLNVWTHVAVCRASTASNDTRLFINGVLDGTGTDATNWTVTTTPMVGYNAAGANYYFSGYMTDMRVIKGSALYTANFTPPTSSLSSVANTQLLTLQYRRGENNHRFVDEGGNKYLVTRAGQVSQGSFSPFSPAGWSGYFDGTGDYLTVTGSSNLAFGTNDFTIECFVYFNNVTTSGFIYDSRTAGNQAVPTLYFGGGAIFYYVSGSIRITSSTIVTNQWYHILVSRVSGSTRMFLNGTQTGSTYTDATTYINNTNRPLMGTNGDAANFFLNGYISNLRVLNGTGYTTVTVPTSQLTTTSQSASNCQLLTLQDNRFIDNSTNAFAITRNGDVKIQAFSPFRPSGSYSPALHGGSAYFDGSDYVASVSTTSTLLPTSSTSTFTIDGWLYPTSLGALAWIIGDLQPTGGTNNVGVDISSSNFIELYWYDGNPKRAISTTAVVLNQWNYFAIVVNSNAITIYVNSTTAGQSGTTTLTTRSAGTSGWAMGTWNSASYYTGYMSSIRWTTGIARTISSIPTAPHSIDANTTVLMNFTHGGVVDATGRHTFETLGDAKISNVASKFGTGSLSFDGTSDGLYEPYNPLYAFGTGDFTIEFWINQSVKTGYQTIMTFGYTPQVAYGWLVQTGNGDGNIIFYYMNASPTSIVVASESGSTVNTGTWYHIMIVKTGGNTRIYRNGTQVATGADTNSYLPATTTKLYIGGGSSTGFDNYYLNGYIDDLRITRGARTVEVPTRAHLTK